MLTPGSPRGSSRNIMPTPLAAAPSSITASGLPSSPSGKVMSQRPGTKPCENCGVRLTAHSMGIHKEVCNKPFVPSISSAAPPSAAATPASPIAVPQRRVSPGRRTSTPGNPNSRTHTPLDATPRHQPLAMSRKEEPLPSRPSAPATKTFQEAPRLPTVSDTRINEISDDMTNLQRQMLEQQERHKREMFALKKEMESIKRSVSAEDRDFYQASQESMKLISKLSSKIDSLAVDVQEIQASHSALKKEVRQISKISATTQNSQQQSFVGTPSKATNSRDDSQWISHQQQQSSSRVTVEQDSRIDNLNSQLTTVQRDLQLLLKMSKNSTQQQQPQQQFSPDPHTHSRHSNVSSRFDHGRDDNLQLLNFAKEEFTDITRTAQATKHQGGSGALTPRHPESVAGGVSTPHQHPVKRQGGGETSRVYREESMADDTVRRVVTAVQSQPSRSHTSAYHQQPHHARNVAPQYPADRTLQQHSAIYNDSRRVAFKKSPSRSSPPRPGEWRLDHRSASL